MNEAVRDLHAVVPNPLILLTAVPGQYSWFSALDLEGAFFCIPTAEESQQLFAFEWQSPETQAVQQYWTVLPQEFKNAPGLVWGNVSYQPVFSEKAKERPEEWGFPLDHSSPGWKCSARGTVLGPEAPWTLRCSTHITVPTTGETPPYNGFKSI